MSETIALSKLESRLTEFVDRAVDGEDIIIVRGGAAVAKLIGVPEARAKAQRPDLPGIIASLSRLRSEIANVLLVAERRGRLTPAQRDLAFAELKRLPILVMPFDHQVDWAATYDLAHRFGLTFYDACYVQLSAQLREPLATFDKAMRKAAEDLGLPLAI
jgi:prevent-host-death family protein